MGFWSKQSDERSPEPEPLNHASLGVLRWRNEGWWEGATASGLRFSAKGTRSGPSDRLAQALAGTLQSWPEIQKRLKTFLASAVAEFGEPAERADAFVPDGISYLWDAKPECFAVELSLPGDDGSIWRVELEDGEPKHLGRDD